MPASSSHAPPSRPRARSLDMLGLESPQFAQWTFRSHILGICLSSAQLQPREHVKPSSAVAVVASQGIFRTVTPPGSSSLGDLEELHNGILPLEEPLLAFCEVQSTGHTKQLAFSAGSNVGFLNLKTSSISFLPRINTERGDAVLYLESVAAAGSSLVATASASLLCLWSLPKPDQGLPPSQPALLRVMALGPSAPPSCPGLCFVKFTKRGLIAAFEDGAVWVWSLARVFTSALLDGPEGAPFTGAAATGEMQLEWRFRTLPGAAMAVDGKEGYLIAAARSMPGKDPNGSERSVDVEVWDLLDRAQALRGCATLVAALGPGDSPQVSHIEVLHADEDDMECLLLDSEKVLHMIDLPNGTAVRCMPLRLPLLSHFLVDLDSDALYFVPATEPHILNRTSLSDLIEQTTRHLSPQHSEGGKAQANRRSAVTPGLCLDPCDQSNLLTEPSTDELEASAAGEALHDILAGNASAKEAKSTAGMYLATHPALPADLRPLLYVRMLGEYMPVAEYYGLLAQPAPTALLRRFRSAWDLEDPRAQLELETLLSLLYAEARGELPEATLVDQVAPVLYALLNLFSIREARSPSSCEDDTRPQRKDPVAIYSAVKAIAQGPARVLCSPDPRTWSTFEDDVDALARSAAESDTYGWGREWISSITAGATFGFASLEDFAILMDHLVAGSVPSFAALVAGIGLSFATQISDSGADPRTFFNEQRPIDTALALLIARKLA